MKKTGYFEGWYWIDVIRSPDRELNLISQQQWCCARWGEPGELWVYRDWAFLFRRKEHQIMFLLRWQ